MEWFGWWFDFSRNLSLLKQCRKGVQDRQVYP